MISHSHSRLGYDCGWRIDGPSKPIEVDLFQRSASHQNLRIGTERIGSLETFPNNLSRVRRFNERERLSMPACTEQRNAPHIHRQTYVRDSRYRGNPGSGRLNVDLSHAAYIPVHPIFDTLITRYRLLTLASPKTSTAPTGGMGRESRLVSE